MSIDIRRLIAMVDGLLGNDLLCDGCDYGDKQGVDEYGSCDKCRRICADKIIEILEQHAELERKIDFIYEQLAKDFDIPCNFSPIDEIMFNSGRCEQDCREIKPDSECWRRYFEEMQRRAEQ